MKHGGTIVLQYCTPSSPCDHSPVMLGRASETLIKHMGLNSSPLTLTLSPTMGKWSHEWPRDWVRY